MKTSGTKSPFPVLIALLVIAFALLLFWSARQAATHGSRIADSAYYSKGLKYSNTQQEIRTADSRGWQLQTDISDHQLLFRLNDSEGHPIDQAQGQLVVYLGASGQILRLETMRNGPGRYRLDLPENLAGSLMAHIEFAQQDARLSQQLLINL